MCAAQAISHNQLVQIESENSVFAVHTKLPSTFQLDVKSTKTMQHHSRHA